MIPRSAASTFACGLNDWAASTPCTVPEDGRHPVEVAGQLLHRVDLGVPLDLDQHVGAARVLAEQVDRADVGEVLPLDQREAVTDHVALLGEQLLELLLHAVLDQPGVDPELVRDVAEDLVHGDRAASRRPCWSRPRRPSPNRVEQGGDIHIRGL